MYYFSSQKSPQEGLVSIIKPSRYFPLLLLRIKGTEPEEASQPILTGGEQRQESGKQEDNATSKLPRCSINDNICMRVWATIEAVTMGTGKKASGGKEQGMMKGGKPGENIFR